MARRQVPEIAGLFPDVGTAAAHAVEENLPLFGWDGRRVSIEKRNGFLTKVRMEATIRTAVSGKGGSQETP